MYMSSQNSSAVESENVDVPEEEDVLKVLVATDIHLGYNENDAVRGNDSFVTFEEILQNAVKNDVDLLLLGGDLFHESKPSITCYHRCITLLKKYCLGEKPVATEILSDQSRNFCHLKNPIVNYEDPNLNVSIPVFSIHGNHDDPTGADHLSAMDILADTGLINYFGKWTDLTKVEIYPILLKKGDTRLALYGLSHIKDERLSRLYKDEKVTLLRPSGDEEWFNILVLHQNRAQNRGLKNYIPETVLPEFLDLVIWGHEHDCRIDPERSPNGPFITQPGSSVATSLAFGESLPKHVALLLINKTRFALQKIKLNTVRPFVFKDITIMKPEEILNEAPCDYAKKQVEEVIKEMLEEAKKLITPECPKLPLLRLIVNFVEESLISGNAIRMGQEYNDVVANPLDMLVLKVKKTVTKKKIKDDVEIDEDLEEYGSEQLTEGIYDLVNVYLKEKNKDFQILSTKGLCEAVTRFIDRNDTDALADLYKHQTGKTLENLFKIEEEIDESNIDEYLNQFREDRKKNENVELEEITNMLDEATRVQSRPTEDVSLISSGEENADDTINKASSSNNTACKDVTVSRPPRGRGSRGSRRARARAK